MLKSLILNLMGAITLMPKTWITFALLFIYPNWKLTPEDNQPLDQYQLGMLEYITPHIAYLATIAPYVQLISIETKERDYEGIHIWTFALKTPNLMDYEPSMIDTLTDTFKECFPYDSQACFNHSPQIKYLNGLFTIIVPFTC